MKSITHRTGKLEIIERLPNSTNGNPRYFIRVNGFGCRTQIDHQHGYSVPNFDGKIVEATIGVHYGYATLDTIKEIK